MEEAGNVRVMTKRSVTQKIVSMFERPENVLMAFMGIVMSIAILGPLVIILLKSFEVQKGLFASVYSLQNYLSFASPRIMKGIGNSFIIAGGSAFLAGLIGVTLAWITARTDMPFRSALQALNIIPFFISPLVGGIAWSLLASPKMGMLNTALMGLFGLERAPFNIYSIPGIIWVSALFHAPFVYLFCIGPFRQMDPALEEAARVSGSNWIMTTFRITLLLASPAILSALILAFVLSIEDLGSILVLGYPYGIQSISTLIFEGIDQYPPNHNLGAALGILLMSITGFCIVIQRRHHGLEVLCDGDRPGVSPSTGEPGMGAIYRAGDQPHLPDSGGLLTDCDAADRILIECVVRVYRSRAINDQILHVHIYDEPARAPRHPEQLPIGHVSRDHSHCHCDGHCVCDPQDAEQNEGVAGLHHDDTDCGFRSGHVGGSVGGPHQDPRILDPVDPADRLRDSILYVRAAQHLGSDPVVIGGP